MILQVIVSVLLSVGLAIQIPIIPGEKACMAAFTDFEVTLPSYSRLN